jgi:hypothetical protein
MKHVFLTLTLALVATGRSRRVRCAAFQFCDITVRRGPGARVAVGGVDGGMRLGKNCLSGLPLVHPLQSACTHASPNVVPCLRRETR